MEKWKKCPACGVYTDADEEKCPLYGLCEGHELKEVFLSEKEILDLTQQGKIFTKHMGALKEKISEQKASALL
jgi:hypothetical protein